MFKQLDAMRSRQVARNPHACAGTWAHPLATRRLHRGHARCSARAALGAGDRKREPPARPREIAREVTAAPCGGAALLQTQLEKELGDQAQKKDRAFRQMTRLSQVGARPFVPARVRACMRSKILCVRACAGERSVA